jgi:ribosomal protein S18 acetylase RimI-like enzyme
MALTIRTIAPTEIDAVRRLLLANGWKGLRFEPSNFETLIANARESLVALDGERVVGFARALGDGVFNGYLSMLVVDADYRKQGVGRALVERVMGDNPDMTWVLRAARPDVQGFYEKLGFRVSTVAMERVRRETTEDNEKGKPA